MELILLLLLFVSIGASKAIRRSVPYPYCTSLHTGIGNATLMQNANGANEIYASDPLGLYCFSNGFLSDGYGRNCDIIPSGGLFSCSFDLPQADIFTIANNKLLQKSGATFLACPAKSSVGPLNLTIFSSTSLLPGCLDIEIFGNFTGSNPTTTVTALDSPSGSIKTVTATDPISEPTSTVITTTFNSEPIIYYTATDPIYSTATAAIIPDPTSESIRHHIAGDAETSSATSTKRDSSSLSTSISSQTPVPNPQCPSDISGGNYLSPRLIVPVSPKTPDEEFGSQSTAFITSAIITTFTFDIPPSYNGDCVLLFQFPYGDDAMFPYSFSGIEQENESKGGLDFAVLSGEVDAKTTFKSMYGILEDFGRTVITPGSNYTIHMGSCQAAQSLSYTISSINDVSLAFIQSERASPLGLFIAPCVN